MDYLESVLAIRSSFTFDEQIRFPSAFGLHAIPEEEKTPPRKRKKSIRPSRRFSMTNRDLRQLADDSQRKCQYYLMKQYHRPSSKEQDIS
ncbi:hypothetical protein NECAME_10738 [Necator americanus]|uniref:Uncharacterized protein n=1 Tax=Necator americanus TaxID=51031 RepID=W2T7K6_NECAM|nr:hypothetical protein NECAME_10738 [Necator americanus]ETN77838.1 hypothetical protein NECAME_10738 [Necator americanus]